MLVVRGKMMTGRSWVCIVVPEIQSVLGLNVVLIVGGDCLGIVLETVESEGPSLDMRVECVDRLEV